MNPDDVDLEQQTPPTLPNLRLAIALSRQIAGIILQRDANIECLTAFLPLESTLWQLRTKHSGSTRFFSVSLREHFPGNIKLLRQRL